MTTKYINPTKSKYYLALHIETTGLNHVIDEPIYKNNNIVALSAVICEKGTFNIIDEKIIFIDHGIDEVGDRWHGITKEFLEEEGVDEESAVLEFANFILEYFDSNDSIICLGQNVHSFVLPFVKNLLYRNEVFIQFSVNALDVFSVTVSTIGETTIQELIELFGNVDDLAPRYQQKEYACLLKARTFVETFRKIDKTWIKLTNK